MIFKFIFNFFKKSNVKQDINKKPEEYLFDKLEEPVIKKDFKENDLRELYKYQGSFFFYGSENGKVRKLLNKNNFLVEINKMFPGINKFQGASFKELHKNSSFSNDSYDKFLFEFSKLTTKQMLFFVYKKFVHEQDICYKTATPYNKRPKKPKWYEIKNSNIIVLLFSERSHLRYLDRYLSSLK